MRNSTETRRAWFEPGRPIRRGVAALAVFVAGLAGWSVFVPLSDASLARGSLAVEGRSQIVQHPGGGVVSDLRVAEGDTVARGDVLMTLGETEARAQRDVLLTRREALRARLARLIAERDGLTAPDYPAATPDARAAAEEARASQTALLRSRLDQRDSAIVVIDRRIDQLAQRIAGAEAEVAGLIRQTDLTTEELQDLRSLLEKGLARRPEVLDLERQLARLQASVSSKQSEIAEGRQSIAEAEAEIARLVRDRRAGIATEIEATQAELADTAPRVDAAEEELSRMRVRAPASGRVVGLSVHTVGGVVQPGATLMQIVPSDAPFVVEAQLALTDLHDIHEGQPARIELLAYPRSERPELSAVVETISADSFTDDRTGRGYYGLTLRLQQDQVSALGIELQSGMPVQVIMETRARTLIAYLTSPLMDQIGTAFSED
ncbi:HlyD family type I secretion periplasmic adaptor subunit [Pseudooceanicola aestuarii]|uniref:HlyD family type I secretion periplasmic adaptor subunit n=1 Tax=Pseudooceanicola aestuarii TaxID=2697319 RepID=UPI0013D61DAE|nr:HlyD family type I secretion periplasmic adaptor subunit [Pseudooceanicola aestuarii]